MRLDPILSYILAAFTATSGGEIRYQLVTISFPTWGPHAPQPFDEHLKIKGRQAPRLPPPIPHSQGSSLLSLASNTVECTVQPNWV